MSGNRYRAVSLCNAVSQGDIDKVKDLLETFGLAYCTEVNPNEYGYSHLREALLKNYYEIAFLLLEKKARVSMNNMRHDTPLHLAAKSGDKRMVRLLLNNGADIEATNGKNETPLYVAIEGKQKRMIVLLLSRGANASAEDENGVTPLHIASFYGFCDLIETFINYTASIHVYSRTNPNKFNVSGLTPLHWAIEGGQDKAVEVLLKYGADIYAEDGNDLQSIHIAAKCGNVNTIKHLFNYGAHVNTLNDSWLTPLHIASSTGSEAVVKFLIRSAADVNAIDKAGNTPLFIATEKGLASIVKILLKSGADVNASNGDFSSTALHCASIKGYAHIVYLLIQHGAIVDIRDGLNRTPLHKATMNGHLESIKALVRAGADLFAINSFGVTPMTCVTALRDMHRTYPLNHWYVGSLILTIQVVKLQAANLLSNEEARDNCNKFRFYLYRNKCILELTKMKHTLIGATNITYYDFLTDGMDRLIIYIQNRSLIRIFQSNWLETKFPIYGYILSNKYQKAVASVPLYNSCYKSLNVIFYNMPLPCAEKILGYLDETDLENLTRAFPAQ